MVYATSMHAPVHTGTLESFNEADIRKMPGVIATVRLPNGVAVVAEHFEQAKAARDAHQGDLEGRRGGRLRFRARRSTTTPSCTMTRRRRSPTCRKKGDVDAAFAGAAKKFSAEYRSDYGYHAQMEPLNAVVRVAADGQSAEVWEGTQAADATRDEVAKALGIAPDKVKVTQCYMGGGFGRRSLGDYAAECARIAKAVGPPGEAGLDPRGGHRPRHVPPAVVPVHRGGAGRERQGDRLAALRGRRRRRAAAHRHPDPVLRRAEPEHRAARRLARHPAQALARGRARVQRHGDREHGRRDGDRRQDGPDRLPHAADGDDPEGAQVLRDGRTDVRLEGAASGRPRARPLDHRALRLARRGRGGNLAQPRRPARSRCTRCGSRWTAAPS